MEKMRKCGRWLETAASLLYPARCPVCDEVLGMGVQRMCPACERRVQYLSEPLCCRCGKKLSDPEAEFCGDCGRGRHLFTAGRALYEYEDIAPALYRFKYDGRREYARFFGRELAGQLGG
ncbi:MAG: double zinc ribbon domain-containing protein, partial [Acetatifactor sp.]|nr:double zinc ribbon domain-containing protein [Acetatifactor sp.]